MTKIQWTDATWNPVSGCARVHPGCDNCYAVQMTHRLEAMGQVEKYGGLTVLNNRGDRHFNGVIKTHEDALEIPLRRRKPTMWFVNSMSDLFHRDVPFEFIDKVFAVMALCPQHTFQILTKRPERMAQYLNGHHQNGKWWKWAEIINSEWKKLGRRSDVFPWPLPNVWLGTSPCDQATADESIPHLLCCPATVRFLSCEPLIGPINLRMLQATRQCTMNSLTWRPPSPDSDHRIDWVIVGGESGAASKIRPCNVEWIRQIVQQCKAAGVPVFVKQLGSLPYDPDRMPHNGTVTTADINHPEAMETIARELGENINSAWLPLTNSKGGDMAEWPEDLRVREFPDATHSMRGR